MYVEDEYLASIGYDKHISKRYEVLYSTYVRQSCYGVKVVYYTVRKKDMIQTTTIADTLPIAEPTETSE